MFSTSALIQMQSKADGRRRPRPREGVKKAKRRPLTDTTNAHTSSSFPSHLKNSRSNSKSSASPTPIPEGTCIPGAEDASEPPRSPLRENESFLDSGEGTNCGELETLIVYSRSVAKGKKSKGKEPQTTSSCPPVERIRSRNDGKSVDGSNTNRQKASSVPSNKPKKKQRCEGPDADFLEKQKAYFEESALFDDEDNLKRGSGLSE
ncbi:uncharacterized protein LOC122001441 isoform X1 [Zingiber officinale]|uniref:uncharacterized protein LOC122001441 isoform X1 n=1 Tax=Zingiber officinale TaxID=94328 RepID=UPI001C4BC77C|nr:uncharacterized protein LOC122001441 isoform X1 [Zingiber officinale]